MMSDLVKTRTEEERQAFFKKYDGWTEFKIESVVMFGETYIMSQCVKCKHIESLYELHQKLFPLHCNGCGRTTLEQDRIKYKSILNKGV